MRDHLSLFIRDYYKEAEQAPMAKNNSEKVSIQYQDTFCYYLYILHVSQSYFANLKVPLIELQLMVNGRVNLHFAGSIFLLQNIPFNVLSWKGHSSFCYQHILSTKHSFQYTLLQWRHAPQGGYKFSCPPPLELPKLQYLYVCTCLHWLNLSYFVLFQPKTANFRALRVIFFNVTQH